MRGPANTKHAHDIDMMLAHFLRSWPNFTGALGQRLLFAGRRTPRRAAPRRAAPRRVSHVAKNLPCIISIPKKNRIFTRRGALGGATFAEFCGAAQRGAARRLVGP